MYQPKTYTAAISEDHREPRLDRAPRVRASHPLHTRRAEQPGRPQQQHEQDEPERHDELDVVHDVQVLRRHASPRRRRSSRRRPRRAGCRIRRARRPRTSTRGSPACSTPEARAGGMTSAPASAPTAAAIAPAQHQHAPDRHARRAGSTPDCDATARNASPSLRALEQRGRGSGTRRAAPPTSTSVSLEISTPPGSQVLFG